MSLTKKDLLQIKELFIEERQVNRAITKDIVEFAIEKSEMRMTEKIEKIDRDLNEFRKEMHHEISDIAETTREVLGRLENHEVRITKLEAKRTLA